MIEISLSAGCFDEIARKMRLEAGESVDFPGLRFTRVAPGANSVLAIFPIPLSDDEIAAASADQGTLMKLRQRLLDTGFSISPGLLRSMLREAR